MAKKNRRRQEIVIKKDILYRGKDIDYLKGLDVREAAKFLPSRSRRTVLKNFDKVEKFIKSCEKKLQREKRIKTHLRSMVIMPKLVGMTIGTHNGKTFQDVVVIPDMIGHRLGEFTLTRSKVSHGAAGIGATKGSKALKK
ncbi:MAG: ribosomal protein S19 family protein [Nanoarchaeota archaeon]|mgnify:CR=1 FL=1